MSITLRETKSSPNRMDDPVITKDNAVIIAICLFVASVFLVSLYFYTEMKNIKSEFVELKTEYSSFVTGHNESIADQQEQVSATVNKMEDLIQKHNEVVLIVRQLLSE